MEKLSITKVALLLCGVLASGNAAAAEPSVTQSTGSDGISTRATPASRILYTVKRGDSLTKIAKRLTGDMSNWRVIARSNNIRRARDLARGDVINIPVHLIRRIRVIDLSDSPSHASDIGTSGKNITASLPISPGSSLSINTSNRPEINNNPYVHVHKVNVNRTFDVQPIGTSTRDFQISPLRSGAEPIKVKIRGSYFPQGIYDEPLNYGRLIKRAAPGTEFELANEVNDWYKIRTENGFGYIRRSESSLIEN